MKKILKSILVVALLGVFTVSCSDWTENEREIIQHPEQQSPILRDNAYYQALRDYKKTNHKVAFGWYGSWTAVGASYQTRLQSAPDSMDIISIWSQWHTLTPEQMADKDQVRKLKGTKVTFTIFAHEMPEPFLSMGNGEYTEEAIAAYAKAYCKDSMDKYNYDGIDLDYEPGFGGHGGFVGHDDPEMRTLVLEMSKYVGPRSGTGRLFLIDGVPSAVHSDIIDCFDYGISQAYNSRGYSDLQNRFDAMYNKGWKPEQIIFAENFESYWKTGGVNHTTRDGQQVNSLLGMARFNANQGFLGGFGAYHMEYEYANTEAAYKYMRQAIQDVNPAGGALVISLGSAQLSKAKIIIEDDGSLTGEVADSIDFVTNRPVPTDMSFATSLNNDLVKEYNTKHGTEYKTIDPSLVEVGSVNIAANNYISAKTGVKVQYEKLAKGSYLIPIVVEFLEDETLTVKGSNIHYLLVELVQTGIQIGATEVTGTKVTPNEWKMQVYQHDKSSGANGVWSFNNDVLFDGKLGNGWYGNRASWSWGQGGNFILDMDQMYEVTGMRWHGQYWTMDPKADVIDVVYSEDGQTWKPLAYGVPFKPVMTDDGWKIFQFKQPIKAQHLRVYVGPFSNGYISMDEFEVYQK